MYEELLKINTSNNKRKKQPKFRKGKDLKVGGGGVDVHDAAADGELARALDHAAAGVACVAELFQKVIQGVFLTHLQGEGGVFQHRRGNRQWDTAAVFFLP